MSYELKKPCSLEERMNFIIKYENEERLRLVDTEMFLYALEENEMMQDNKPVINPNWESEQLEIKRQQKFDENEFKRDRFLSCNIIYKQVSFDSDLEQRQNLDYTINHMEDGETKNWISSDGITKLECTKQDLQNINLLINTKITYVWEFRNPEIKLNIKNAKSVEELNIIDISYVLPTILD